MALADYQALVDAMVRRDASIVLDADRDTAIELARLRYSEDAGRELTEDVVWTAEGYLGPLPASWVTGSSIISTEYPIGEEPPQFAEIAVYLTPTAQQLASADVLPAGATVRVTYMAPHLLQDAPATPADTIPLKHREAVASYAAQILCGQLAAYYSGQRDSAVGADSSNGDTRARNFSSRARDYRAAYYAGIGMADPRSDKGAGGTAGQAAASSSAWKGRERVNLTRVAPP